MAEKAYIKKQKRWRKREGNKCNTKKHGKYIAFMLGQHFVLLESFQFMSSSLDKLAGNLPDEETKKEFFHMIIWAVLINLMKK